MSRYTNSTSGNRYVYHKGLTVVITGGTGSFGQALTKRLIHDPEVNIIRVFSRDELKQSEMARHITSDKLRFFIGDTRDEARLISAFKDADIVIHAAALKQVPACEYNPNEAVKTNIFGTQNVISACIKNNVKMAVLLSTDKAVDPVNLYGATKLVAEKIWLNANQFSETGFAVTRWGNVIASRGSVIPLFQEQAKTGTVTITDKRMTRFLLTLDEAVDFLWGVAQTGVGGLYIPSLKSARVVDIAKVVAPKAKIVYVGIREGEKIHETLGSDYFSNDKLRLQDISWVRRKLDAFLRKTKHK